MTRSVPALLALAALACTSPGEGDTAPPATSDGLVPVAQGTPFPFPLTPRQERGRAIFEAVCWTCHGPAARGDGPAVLAGASSAPPDLTSGEYVGLTAEQLHARFDTLSASGNPRHPHMRFVLSFMDSTAFGAALSYVPALVYPPEIPGSALAGRVLYERHCQPCHGASGDGRGPAADMLSVTPASFLGDTLVAAGSFQALVDKILQGGALLHGSPMPAWGMFFDERMGWDVVAYISSFQPGVLSAPPVAGPR
jgi:mono/diheme cytochrome c family protein